jgi:tyrosine-protein phosphatase SIW14
VKAAGMTYISVPMNGGRAPSNEQVVRVLRLFDSDSAPVFVHCKRGADRTGTVVACYRIVHDHWDNRRALNEARSLGGMHWFEFSMQRFVLGYSPAAYQAAAGAGSAQPVTLVPALDVETH